MRKVIEDKRSRKHGYIALIGILPAVLVITLLFSPIEFKGASVILLSITSLFFFKLGMRRQNAYNGYGVAAQINEITDRKLIPVWETVSAVKIPKKLIEEWFTAAIVSFVVLALSPSIIRVLGNFWFTNITLAVLVFASLGRIIAIPCEIYVWLAANRRYHWCVSETDLRKTLMKLELPMRQIERMVVTASERGLLLTL